MRRQAGRWLRGVVVLRWLLCVLWMSGCGETQALSLEAPVEEVLFDDGPEHITVSGTARVFAPAARWLGVDAATDAAPGGRVVLEDPLQRALGDPEASCGETPLESNATFSIAEVPVGSWVLGLAAGVEDAELAPVPTLLYDAGRQGTRPREDLLDQQVEVVPRSWLEAIEAWVGSETLASWAPGAQGLLGAGFVLGQVVDAAGEPVAGARISVDPPELAERLRYPPGTLSGAETGATDASGVFLLVHDGGDVRTLSLTPEHPPGVLPSHAVLAPERGILLRLVLPP